MYKLENNIDFLIISNRMLLARMRVVSLVSVIVFIYNMYVDLIFFKHIPDSTFRMRLMSIHIGSVVLSTLFLLLYRIYRNNTHFYHSFLATFLINVGVFSSVFLAALSSINSQRLSGNIDAYAIILLSVAVIYPLRPKYTLSILLTNHIFFIFLLWLTSTNKYSVMTKQMNTTVALIIACFISISFYTNRKQDYINKLLIQEKEQSFRNLFEINTFPQVLIRMNESNVVLINQKALAFYGFTLPDIQNKDAIFLFKDEDEKQSILKQVADTGSISNYIIEQHLTSGLHRWVMVNFEYIEYRKEPCMLCGIIDITDLKRMEAQLTIHATTDNLTGILNRRSGMELVQNALLQPQQKPIHFTICFIDVNNLKYVNDTFGHAEGDHLIYTVCQVIMQAIQKEDIFFRYGGDEFIIVFLQKSIIEIDKIWSNILNTFDEINHSLLHDYTISASHGLYQFNSDTDIPLEELIRRADFEMYKEKAALK